MALFGRQFSSRLTPHSPSVQQSVPASSLPPVSVSRGRKTKRLTASPSGQAADRDVLVPEVPNLGPSELPNPGSEFLQPPVGVAPPIGDGGSSPGTPKPAPSPVPTVPKPKKPKSKQPSFGLTPLSPGFNLTLLQRPKGSKRFTEEEILRGYRKL
jgi:hypothetical protein